MYCHGIYLGDGFGATAEAAGKVVRSGGGALYLANW